MNNNLSSPSINKAIGKLAAKKARSEVASAIIFNNVVTVLDCLGYLGVLDYSRFNPDLLEQALRIGNHVLEVETIDKDSN